MALDKENLRNLFFTAKVWIVSLSNFNFLIHFISSQESSDEPKWHFRLQDISDVITYDTPCSLLELAKYVCAYVIMWIKNQANRLELNRNDVVFDEMIQSTSPAEVQLNKLSGKFFFNFSKQFVIETSFLSSNQVLGMALSKQLPLLVQTEMINIEKMSSFDFPEDFSLLEKWMILGNVLKILLNEFQES